MFKYLVLLNALTLSAVAAYYSILGLITIFSAAAIPVAVMGTSMEVGKLVTAAYLHNHWKTTNWLLKTYLTAAVIVLMVITSLGIFGLLSKANIDANLTVRQTEQRIEQIDRQVSKLNTIQEESEIAFRAAADRNLTQSNDEIDILRSQLRQSQNSLDTLDSAIQLSDVEQIQTIVGVTVDGRYGPNTEKSVKSFRLNEEKKIDDLNDRIRTLNDRLQDQKVSVTITDNTEEIKTLTKERFTIEKTLTELEAEIGPIKYISELLYSNSENTTTEQAVRWMIIVIVLVFDPLAIAMLLAFQQLNHKQRKTKNVKENFAKIKEPTYVEEDSEGYYYSEEETKSYSEEEAYGKKVVTEQPSISVAPRRKGKVAAARKAALKDKVAEIKNLK